MLDNNTLTFFQDTCLKANGNGGWCLKATHKYFTQIQGELACTDREVCISVIYAKHWMHVERVLRDRGRWESKMEPKLKWSVNT